MSYKILEQNGIDIENIDGAAFNNFAAGGRDGIMAGVLSECALVVTGKYDRYFPGRVHDPRHPRESDRYGNDRHVVHACAGCPLSDHCTGRFKR